MNSSPDNLDRIDQPIADRLGKLRGMPLDSARFDAAIQRAIPKPRARRSMLLWPVRAVAASVLLGTIAVIVFLAVTSRPVVASPERMAQIYQSTLAEGHATSVTSIDEARAHLRQIAPKLPSVPESAEMPVMACCVHEVGRKEMACVVFSVDGVPVTVAVADAKDIRNPHGTEIQIGGRTYRSGSADGVNMLMSERDGVWTCVMSKLPPERLSQIVQTFDR